MKITSDQIENFEDPASGKLKYLRPIIVLVPAFTVCVYDIYAKISFMDSMLRLFITIIFFYVVGSIAQSIVRRLMIQAMIDKAKKNDIFEGEDEDDEYDEDEDEEEN